MVLKWSFVNDTGEETLHITCPGLLRDGTSNCYDSFSGKIILKRSFLSDTEENFAHLFRSQGDGVLTPLLCMAP